MEDHKRQSFIKQIVTVMPSDWLKLTTHRLDIYNESLAKSEFLDELEKLYESGTITTEALEELPTAYDYIRLGHPLSSVLEWLIAKSHNIASERVISFDSKTIPVMAVLRKNLLDNKKTIIYFKEELPTCFDQEALQNVYGYQFELKSIASTSEIDSFDGSIVLIEEKEDVSKFELESKIDFYINYKQAFGSVLLINGDQNANYESEIQHVRRRETIAMTPINTLFVLQKMTGQSIVKTTSDYSENKNKVQSTIEEITESKTKAVVASSGLSMQYAIVMGLIEDALETNKGKKIKIIVPPNCYGGTNDQARRVAACLDHVEVMDLPVDGGNDMVQSIDQVLDQIAKEDAVPYIIAEIPTNPRVEVPDMIALEKALAKERTSPNGTKAIDPVFILDQTFCPNVHFLGETEILSSVRTIAYVSGSKFPSGGKCTAGYCVANGKASKLMEKIDKHLRLCDNEATDLQMEILAKQMPSMVERIAKAYDNTREFVSFIEDHLPEAKINFVSEALAKATFTPSVFSLDLPTKGNSEEEKEAYKRELNLKLINMMIQEIPRESKFCVSYGQLKGCYWTIPATSTQGTTKEGDKDYIVRVALAPELNLERHKEVFLKFVNGLS